MLHSRSLSASRARRPHQLGGASALLKAHSTKVFEYCAREAAQIFGGASYVRGGQGEKVERLYREVRAYAIPGASCRACAHVSCVALLPLVQRLTRVLVARFAP